MRTFFLCWAGTIAVLFALWFLVSFIAGPQNQEGYLSLLRGGILISALIGMTAAFLYRQSKFVGISLLVLLAGFLSHYLHPGGAVSGPSFSLPFLDDLWWRSKEGFLRPRGPRGLSLADLTVLALIIGNAVWFLKNLTLRRILAGNFLLLAAALALAVLLP